MKLSSIKKLLNLEKGTKLVKSLSNFDKEILIEQLAPLISEFKEAQENLNVLKGVEKRAKKFNKFSGAAKFARDLNAITISKTKFVQEQERLEKKMKEVLKNTIECFEKDDDIKARQLYFNELMSEHNIPVRITVLLELS